MYHIMQNYTYVTQDMYYYIFKPLPNLISKRSKRFKNVNF